MKTTRPTLGLIVSALVATAAPAAEIEGLVVPSQQVTLSAPLDGIVEAMPFTETQTVAADAVVVKMDDRLQQVEVEKARVRAETTAALREAKAILDEQKVLLERARETLERGAASAWEVRRAEVQVEQADASYENTQDGLRLAATEVKLQEAILAQHELHAPFDGRVLRTLVEPGATVQRGEELLVLVKLDPLEAEVFLPIDYYGRLETGAAYTLRPDPVIRAEPLTATLKTLDPVIDSASRTFRCVFTIPNPGEQLPAGFSVFFDPDAE